MLIDAEYLLAVATLDAYIGIRFHVLQAAQSASEVDEDSITQLKLELDTLHKRRDHLHENTVEELQTLIDDLSPKVKKAVQDQCDAPGT
ncbi:MAG: hypothetical protein V4713_12330 [Pseudomonadota bacterium]